MRELWVLNPTRSAKKTDAYASDFFIQAAGLAYHHDAVVDIIKGGEPPLYLITRQRVSTCGLMKYSPESEIYSFSDG